MGGGVVPPDEVKGILPSALLVGDWQLYVLAVLYLITSLLCVAFIIIHYLHNRPNVRWFSFKITFLAVAAIFMLFRFLIALVAFPYQLFGLMLCSTFLPMLLQFTTFSLLILFLARRLYLFQGKERMVTRRLYPIYASVLGLFWVGSIVVNYVLAEQSSQYQRDSYDAQTSIYATLAFGFTVTRAIVQGIYAYKTFRVLSSIALTLEKRRQVQRYMIIISIYLFVFMIRTVWSLLNFLYVNKLQELFYTYLEEGSPLSWTIYCVYFLLVEIAPVVSIAFILALMSSKSNSNAPEKKPFFGDKKPENGGGAQAKEKDPAAHVVV